MIADKQLRKILVINERGFIKRNESSTLEFKANFSLASLPQYAKTMAAFANNKGGIIIFGVTDHPRCPIGLENDKFINLDSARLQRSGCLALFFFLKAVSEQAKENTGKARAILALYEDMKQKVPEITRSQYAIQAIDTLFARPLFKSADFINHSGISKDSAFRIINELKRAGIIRTLREGKGRRPAIWAFQRLLEITEDIG